MAPEYSVEGRFPGTKRILGVGPHVKTFTRLDTDFEITQDGTEWYARLDIIVKGIRKPFLVKNKKDGTKFQSEDDLLAFIDKKYSVSYRRDRSKPAFLK